VFVVLGVDLITLRELTARANIALHYYLITGQARRITSVCLSVAFFNTSVYTRFFSLEEALRIKSEKVVDLTVLSFENIDIPLKLD